ncbi:hypothetical protein Acr_23g0019950 [Actinidia rufa]|uniref:Uncharacterized protein n=1 Tax=Actinidia rufa TaxID=165716 RepID=A0A7J0GS10_9ERIC|nr:hypothetical protein Acr_23g0019950 [Actinidia rufa]
MVASVRTPPPPRPGWSFTRFGGALFTVVRSLDIRDGWCCWKWGVGTAARSCIRRPLFSFMILICSAISCISRWRPSRSGAWPGLAIGWDLLPGGYWHLVWGEQPTVNAALFSRHWASDAWKATCTDEQKSGLFIDGVMGRVHGSRRDPGKDRILVERLIKPSILPRLRARRRQHFGFGRADEHSDSGSGEVSGDDLARFHGLVLPQSRGFGDEQPLKKSRATSFVMMSGRRAYLGR